MGFRSTMVSMDRYIDWPVWFREKYPHLLLNTDLDTGTALLGITIERKTGFYSELPRDVQQALHEVGEFKTYPNTQFVYVWLHECGGITRVQVEAHNVFISYPESWVIESETTTNQDSIHCYCYGCSDAEQAQPMILDGTPQPEIGAGS
jgi:hypothetical protein